MNKLKTRRNRYSIGKVCINFVYYSNPIVIGCWNIFMGLQQIGISKKQIYAAALDKRNEGIAFVDTIHRSDGKGFLDLPALLATLFMTFGCIYGFILRWGPIIWTLIGFVTGLTLGVIIRLIQNKLNQKSKTPKTEIVIIVDCKNEEAVEVEKILWNNKAFGVSKTTSLQQ